MQTCTGVDEICRTENNVHNVYRVNFLYLKVASKTSSLGRYCVNIVMMITRILVLMLYILALHRTLCVYLFIHWYSAKLSGTHSVIQRSQRVTNGFIKEQLHFHKNASCPIRQKSLCENLFNNVAAVWTYTGLRRFAKKINVNK